jgi:hypothetical protein
MTYFVVITKNHGNYITEHLFRFDRREHAETFIELETYKVLTISAELPKPVIF